MMKKITAVEVLGKYVLRITFDDARVVKIDFSCKIQPGTVTAALSDFETFKQVKIVRSGRAIEWPGELDFCADSLWLEGTGEANPYLQQKAS